MKVRNSLVLLIFLFFLLGCGVLQKLRSGSNSATPSPTPEAVSPTPSPSATEASKENAFSQEKDLLAFASGTIFAQKPPEYAPGTSYWGALGLIDEIPGRGWAMNVSADSTGTSMVLEMPEKSLLKTLVFDNGQAEDQASAKDITVEISDVSATTGFEEVLSTTLADHKDAQVFELQKQIPGHWVRLTVKNNYGSDKYTEIMEFRGYGDQITSTPPTGSINGTYKMSAFGPFHIKQDGTTVSGCYEYASGLFDGGVDNRVINITWSESSDGKERHGGPAIMIFSPDGKHITGAWARDDFDRSGFAGEWNGEKISDRVGNCPQAPNLDKKNAAKDTIGTDLKEKGRSAVYGINFNFNSDMIQPESQPTLDQIVSILKENADWKMTVEGHTDNIGGEVFNQSLSERRAAAVVKYLIDAGIAAARLTSAGFGSSKPVASNDTEFGRAQNRRVELVKN